MKRSIGLLVAGIFLPLSLIFSQDTIRVMTHNRILMVTDPVKGEKSYPAWTTFPSENISIRTIRMHVTLGCPDSIPCAHWDYLDHIYLRRQGSLNQPPKDFELGRLITPYGSIFEKGWNWTWTTDITDFSILLRDSAEIEYVHSGYEPASVGWTLSITFEFITGKPVIKPYSLSKMWEGSFRYGDPAIDIEKSLSSISVNPARKTSIARLRIQQTGHGMDEPKGCSEFCSRYRDTKVNGVMIDRRTLWKECGTNPLFPQGGTWIFDRGNWCPGDMPEADQYDIDVKSRELAIDIDMEPYTASSNIQANESIASYLIEYSSPTSPNDAAIDQILSPTDDKKYGRMNPVCSEPHIIIRNLGRSDLHSVIIEYGTEGFPFRRHTWNGKLKFNESVDVWLEGPVKFRPGINTFFARLVSPNGKKDGWITDNVMKSHFNSPLLLPEKLVIQFRTNNNPSDNKISVMDAFGGIQYIREARSLAPNTLYQDTIFFPSGCYELNLSDSSGNGLEFWFEPEQGYGFLRLLDEQGRLLHNFESDCGSGQHLAFSTSPGMIYDTSFTRFAFSLFPLRVKDRLLFDCVSSKPEDILVLIKGPENVLIEKHQYLGMQNQLTYIDVNHLKPGRYFFEVEVKGKRQFKKRFNKE